MSLAQLTVFGTVGKVFDARTSNDRTFRSFMIAKDEPYQEEGETKFRATWYTVTSSDRYVLEKMGDLKPGDKIIASGTFSPRPYTTNQGETRFELRIAVANSGGLSVVRKKAEAEGANTPAETTKAMLDQEIPF